MRRILRTRPCYAVAASMVGCGLVASAARAAAQRPSSATLVVTVLDTAETPIAQAEVILQGGDARGVSGSDGRVVLANLSAGRTQALIRRVGFTPRQLTLNLRDGDTVAVDVRLEPRPVILDDIAVVSHPGLTAFDRRMKSAIFSPQNSFYPPEALDTFPPTIQVSEILLRSGIVKRPFGGIHRLACPRDLFGNPSKPVMVVLNGIVYPDPDDLFFTTELGRARIRAMEIYRSGLEAPLDLPKEATDNGCIVVVWSR